MFLSFAEKKKWNKYVFKSDCPAKMLHLLDESEKIALKF